jgi:arylsulfatase A-like enzyme
VRQSEYVDRLVERLLAPLRQSGQYDGTAIVILSDHGYRFHGHERDLLQIPFIAKHAGQHTKVDASEPERGEVLLKRFLESACDPGLR